MKEETFWNDDKVIDFVNWYVELKKLGFNYTLENMSIIDSFKNGDKPSDWHINDKSNKIIETVLDDTPTVYLMDIDNEATVVVANNITEAMNKAENISKINYKMAYHKSVPILY